MTDGEHEQRGGRPRSRGCCSALGPGRRACGSRRLGRRQGRAGGCANPALHWARPNPRHRHRRHSGSGWASPPAGSPFVLAILLGKQPDASHHPGGPPARRSCGRRAGTRLAGLQPGHVRRGDLRGQPGLLGPRGPCRPRAVRPDQPQGGGQDGNRHQSPRAGGFETSNRGKGARPGDDVYVTTSAGPRPSGLATRSATSIRRPAIDCAGAGAGTGSCEASS